MMFGRPNLFVNSYAYLFFKAKPGLFRNLELAGITGFWLWFSLLLRGLGSWQMRLAYVAICFAVTSPLHVQVTRSASHIRNSKLTMPVYRLFCRTLRSRQKT